MNNNASLVTELDGIAVKQTIRAIFQEMEMQTISSHDTTLTTLILDSGVLYSHCAAVERTGV